MVPFLIDQHKQGKYPLDKLIQYYNANDYLRAFQDMKAGKVLKPVLIWKNDNKN